METMILPKQARDKHRENSKKDAAFRTCTYTRVHTTNQLQTIGCYCPEHILAKNHGCTILADKEAGRQAGRPAGRQAGRQAEAGRQAVAGTSVCAAT